ncbi:MAG: glycine cleavage system aminomethyltransferase GcvT [Candidatus Dadabacteria bacterium]|nr:MAG: glycine cleavage system aminomethyltransferase GcvT [Candidatus Dadabacteria bacterium]
MVDNMGLKRTPLYEIHRELGARLVPFAGWEMPVRYSSIVEEHMAVRKHCGIFDVSHMGEIECVGSEADRALNYLTCNDVSKLVPGKAQYTAITNERGGVVDDIIIYMMSPGRYLLCVNAANIEKDFSWLSSHNKFDAEFLNRSDEFGQIAIQGPKAVNIAESVLCLDIDSQLKYFHHMSGEYGGEKIIIARTGYTGEDGVEVFIPAGAAKDLWDKLMEADSDLKPCGLGARDTLRLEAALPLYGHELRDDITALESGIGIFVKIDKGNFMGSDILKRQKEEGVKRKLVGFKVLASGIVRENSMIYAEGGEEIGFVTSGTKTPFLDAPIGLAILDVNYSKIGTEIFAEVRGKKIKCEVVKRPFYKRN